MCYEVSAVDRWVRAGRTLYMMLQRIKELYNSLNLNAPTFFVQILELVYHGLRVLFLSDLTSSTLRVAWGM